METKLIPLNDPDGLFQLLYEIQQLNEKYKEELLKEAIEETDLEILEKLK